MGVDLPVALQQATATFSQSADGHGVSTMINGTIGDNRGWGIHPNIGDQTAVVETVTNVGEGGPTEVKVRLIFNHKSVAGTQGHTLGRFRLSVTSDNRSEFADGLESGGDVTASWTVLDIESAISESGAMLTELADGSILVSGVLQEEDVYTLTATTEVTGITGFRLEAIGDASFTNGGPGREPSNGNFHVSEMTVSVVVESLAITEQPQSGNVSVGGTLELSVEARGALEREYQWYLNGDPIMEATSSTLAISDAEMADAGTYTVKLSAGEEELVSAPAIVHVTPASPAGAAAFTVSNKAPAPAPVRALDQSLLSGTRYLAQIYAGASASELSPVSGAVPFLTGADAGFFMPIDVFMNEVVAGETAFVQVRVWDSTKGSSFAAAADSDGERGFSEILTVVTGGNGLPAPELTGLTGFFLEQRPRINSHPQAQTVLAGADAEMTVSAVGSSHLTYQWKFNGNDILDATGAALMIPNAQPSMAGNYSVVVANRLGFVVSGPAMLTVDTTVDVNLANATATYSQVGDGHGVAKMINGTIADNRGWGIHPQITNQTAVVETVGDVGFSGGTILSFDLAFAVRSVAGTTGHTLGRFRLSATTDDRNEFADGLQIDGDVTANWTVLEVLSAVSEKGASIVKLGDGSLLVSGTPTVEDVYTVVTATDLTGITGFRLEALEDESLPHDGPGREELNGNFHVSEMVVTARAGLPRIVNQPDSAIVETGGRGTFAVEVSSTLTTTYQWFFNGTALEGATEPTLVIENAQADNEGIYWAEVSNIEGKATSSGALLTVLPAGWETQGRFQVSNTSPASAPISSARGVLLEGLQYRAQVYAGASAEQLLPVSAAVPFMNGPLAGFFLPLEIYLAEAPGLTVQAQVRVWDAAAGGSYEEASANGGERGASAVLPVVLGGNGAPVPELTGLTAFSLEVSPSILAQPADAKALVAGSVHFEVEAFGSGTLSYQWKFNGEEIDGATESSLTLANIELADAGEYSVEVENSLGTVISEAATLVVEIAPTVTLISPAAGSTTEEQITLAGEVGDDGEIVSARWERNGVTGGPITLTAGNFSVPNVSLGRGENILRVIAVDSSGNEGAAEVVVTQIASRTLFVGELAPHQEGSRVGVPIYLASLGGIGGADFVLRFNRNDVVYLETEWDAALDGGIKQINPTIMDIRGNFALSGTAIGAGTQRIATVYFRPLSVHAPVQTGFPLALQGLYSSAGDPLPSFGTDVRGGTLQITRREYVGDNNANDRLDVGDASAIMRMVSRLDSPRFGDVPNNDLNQNQQVDSGDVVKVLRVVVGLDPQPGDEEAPAAPPPIDAELSPMTESGARMALVTEEKEIEGKLFLHVKANLEGLDEAISALSFRLEYPVQALRLDGTASHTAGGLVPQAAAVIWNVSPAQNDYLNQDGRVSVAISSDSNWLTSNGTVAEFIFAVQEEAGARYRWPITISQVELASNFELISPAGADIYYSTRAPVAAALSVGESAEGEGIAISLAGEIGERYLIEVSDDLEEWTELTAILNISGSVTFNDEEAGARQRFYRATQIE